MFQALSIRAGKAGRQMPPAQRFRLHQCDTFSVIWTRQRWTSTLFVVSRSCSERLK
jgi:hypothetical protein